MFELIFIAGAALIAKPLRNAYQSALKDAPAELKSQARSKAQQVGQAKLDRTNQRYVDVYWDVEVNNIRLKDSMRVWRTDND